MSEVLNETQSEVLAARRVSMPRAEQFAFALLRAAGMDAEKSEVVARLLVLTDGMGRRTHGLAMLPLYLAELAKYAQLQGGPAAGMKPTGEPTQLKDNGLIACWDGHYLPGLWLVHRAIQLAMPRAAKQGVGIVSIFASHHIGCLAALVKEAADLGFVAMIANSDPAGQRVAPYGGTEALFTPNPFAIGYPTSTQSVLVDICASITTTSMTRQKYAAGETFEHPWLLDAQGVPTNDPAVLEHANPRGSLQLIGGQEYGHKGFGFTLMNEALSQGLSGHGRKDAPTRWGGNVFVQVLDPNAFAGRDAFLAQVDHTAQRSRATRPIDPAKPVRMPGDQAHALLAQARELGIEIPASTWAALSPWMDRFQVPAPTVEP